MCVVSSSGLLQMTSGPRPHDTMNEKEEVPAQCVQAHVWTGRLLYYAVGCACASQCSDPRCLADGGSGW